MICSLNNHSRFLILSLPQSLVKTEEKFESSSVSGSSVEQIPNVIEDLEIKGKSEAIL